VSDKLPLTNVAPMKIRSQGIYFTDSNGSFIKPIMHDMEHGKEYGVPKSEDNAFEIVLAFASFYKSLVEKGIYHPDSEFIIYETTSPSDEQVYTLLSKMPIMEPVNAEDITDKMNEVKDTVPSDILGGIDWEKADDYRRDSKSGKIYLTDLHIVPYGFKNEAVLKRYGKKEK